MLDIEPISDLDPDSIGYWASIALAELKKYSECKQCENRLRNASRFGKYYYCTRPDGHLGPHVAYVVADHDFCALWY